jgi:hypothetical protein
MFSFLPETFGRIEGNVVSGPFSISVGNARKPLQGSSLATVFFGLRKGRFRPGGSGRSKAWSLGGQRSALSTFLNFERLCAWQYQFGWAVRQTDEVESGSNARSSPARDVMKYARKTKVHHFRGEIVVNSNLAPKLDSKINRFALSSKKEFAQKSPKTQVAFEQQCPVN